MSTGHQNTQLPPWRNRLARSAVNRKVGGSSPPGGAQLFFFFCYITFVLQAMGIEIPPPELERILPLLYVRFFPLKVIQRIGVIMSSFPIVSLHQQWLSTDSLSVKYVWVQFVERALAIVGGVSCLICEKKFHVDPGRIRTCNPLIRSQMPYPLGHRARYVGTGEAIEPI